MTDKLWCLQDNQETDPLNKMTESEVFGLFGIALADGTPLWGVKEIEPQVAQKQAMLDHKSPTRVGRVLQLARLYNRLAETEVSPFEDGQDGQEENILVY